VSLSDFRDLAPRERPAGPLQPTEPPRARERGMPRANRARMAARNARAFGPQSRLARLLPCVACGRPSSPTHPTQAAHVLSRGAGGRDCDVVPLCALCHHVQGVVGIETFQRRRGLDLPELARRLADRIRTHVQDGECVTFPERTSRGLRCRICLAPLSEEDLRSP
jgi:cytochrome c553